MRINVEIPTEINDEMIWENYRFCLQEDDQRSTRYEVYFKDRYVADITIFNSDPKSTALTMAFPNSWSTGTNLTFSYQTVYSVIRALYLMTSVFTLEE